LLGSVADEDITIVADLEAGIGTLTRLDESVVDTTIVVVEPTPRSVDVAKRAAAVAEERNQGRIVVVANKIEDDDDRARVEAAFPGHDVVLVPADLAIDQADRLGLSPVDHRRGCPAVVALEALADRLISVP